MSLSARMVYFKHDEDVPRLSRLIPHMIVPSNYGERYIEAPRRVSTYDCITGVRTLQERTNVGNVVREFNLSQKFVDMSYGIFMQLDLDQNGVIDQG